MKINEMNKLKSGLFIGWLFFAGIAIGYSQKPVPGCPRNFDGKAFAKIKKEIKKHDGDTVAFDVEVLKTAFGYNDKPYFQGKMDNGETLWVSSMVSNSDATVGKKLRVLGYLDIVNADDEIGKKYNKGGIQVLAFAILDTETKQLHFSDAFEKEALSWKSGGFIPK